MDATYRADSRELSELNFSRFDSKLEQRVVEPDAKWERPMAALDAKWERRIGEMEAQSERLLAGLRGEMNAGCAALRADRAEIVKETIRWMFVFWVGTTATLLGTMVALLELRRRRPPLNRIFTLSSPRESHVQASAGPGGGACIALPVK